MSNNLEDWKCQQEAKQAAARKEGPLTLAGGTSRREYEEHRVSDELSREAQVRRKVLIESTLKNLRTAVSPEEIAHFRDILLKLPLTGNEQEQLRTLLLEKNG